MQLSTKIPIAVFSFVFIFVGAFLVYSKVFAFGEIRGVSLGEFSSCDYYLIEDSLGNYTLAEWYGGITPDRGDVVVGELHSYGFKNLYNISKDNSTRVWIDDWLLSEDRAAEKLIDKCGYNREISTYFDSGYYYTPTYTPPTPVLSTPTCTENAYYDASSATCKCVNGYSAVGAQCVQLDTACKVTYGGRAEAVLGTSQCACSNGNVWNDAQTECISGLEWCKSKIGGDVVYNQITRKCECSAGYEFNGSSCIESVKKTEQVIPKQPIKKPEVKPQNQLLKNSEEKLSIEKTLVVSSTPTSSMTTPAIEKKQGNFLQRVFQKTAGWFSKLWKK